jgi:hypothetical protein
MAMVDPNDKSIKSYTVRHHKFDPETNHFRWFNLMTFDTETEMDELMNRVSSDIERRLLIGDADLKEQVAGTINEADVGLETRGWAEYQIKE